MKKSSQILIILMTLILPLSACGIKPNSVDAPPTVEKDNFPRQYPASK